MIRTLLFVILVAFALGVCSPASSQGLRFGQTIARSELPIQLIVLKFLDASDVIGLFGGTVIQGGGMNGGGGNSGYGGSSNSGYGGSGNSGYGGSGSRSGGRSNGGGSGGSYGR